MNQIIELYLTNFQKYEEPVCFKFNGGITLLNGRSGAGKSTICRAIHFVLFGGRKHKNITCKSSKSKDTKVSLRYLSDNFCFDITRIRPSESIYLSINNQHKMEGPSAQVWINSVFGTEDSWICSSYLAQDKLHFFLRETNEKKKDLLKQIAFGDETGTEPEEYINVIDKECYKLKGYLDNISNQIKSRNFIIQDIINKTPDILNNGGFDSKRVLELENKYKFLLSEKSRIEISIHDKKRKQRLEEELLKIKVKDEDIKQFYESFEAFKKIKEIDEMRKLLVDFDQEVLKSNMNEVDHDIYLYRLYFENGYKIEYDFKEWIETKKQEHEKYSDFLLTSSKNNEIIEHNKLIENANSSIKREYNLQMNNYSNSVNVYKSYENQKKLIDDKKDTPSNLEKFEEDDDLTSNYLINKLGEYKLLDSELTCPNCNYGLVFKNGCLHKGELYSDNVRVVNQLKIINSTDEIKKRKNYEVYMQELDNFNKITPPTILEKPQEPTYSSLKELLVLKRVPKPSLTIFEEPKIKYDKALKLKKSFNLIESYNKVNSSPYKDIAFSIDDYNQMVSYNNYLTGILAKIDHINDEISKINTDTSNEEDLTKINEEIKLCISLIDIGKKILDIIVHQVEIERLNKDEISIASRYRSCEKLSSFITQIANSSITDIISSINEALEDICSELFGFPIAISLLTTKELKNGNEKNMVNMTISYNGNVYQNPDELSGGELRRVSLALMLAFCRINTSPICIIDEVLSSISNDFKEASLNIIKKWTVGKVVIHICHGITEGFHDNIVNFD